MWFLKEVMLAFWGNLWGKYVYVFSRKSYVFSRKSYVFSRKSYVFSRKSYICIVRSDESRDIIARMMSQTRRSVLGGAYLPFLVRGWVTVAVGVAVYVPLSF